MKQSALSGLIPMFASPGLAMLTAVVAPNPCLSASSLNVDDLQDADGRAVASTTGGGYLMLGLFSGVVAWVQ